VNPAGAAALVLAALAVPTASAAGTLVAQTEAGETVARLDVPDGGRWCVLWRHSVAGFEVADCYRNEGGTMVLERSHLPDFAAGLDHIPGRGRQTSDGRGGYWIEDIDEPVPGNSYLLRVGGPAVDHRLARGGTTVSLTAHAAGERVTVSLAADD
jgi:hypothetical protein